MSRRAGARTAEGEVRSESDIVRLSETNGQVNADDNDVTAGENLNGLEDNVIGEEKEEKVPEAADEVSEGSEEVHRAQRDLLEKAIKKEPELAKELADLEGKLRVERLRTMATKAS